MTKPDSLLIEIGTEELPPNDLFRLSQAFSTNITTAFEQQGITYGDVKSFASPRRMALLIENVDAMLPDKVIQKKGPPLKAAYDELKKPTQALLGFADSLGVEISSLKHLETEKGVWLVYDFFEKGKSLKDVLPEMLLKALHTLPIAKTMRWGNEEDSFVRPIHWIVILHGTNVIPFKAFGVESSNTTYGHRFHAPNPIHIKHPKEYEQDLLAAKVIADFGKRRDSIKEQIMKIAAHNNATPHIEEALLDEVCGLVEWPIAMEGEFNKQYLNLPSEVLITSMQNHQRSFAMMDSSGKILPHFIFISNIDANPPTNIIHGNERVMHARLSDAEFFFKNDLTKPLASHLELLKQMIFQQKLGTLHEKSQRISKLSEMIGGELNIERDLCAHAGLLCKADLLTTMVGEFPELQGIMGKYYARASKEPEDVAVAIEEHYLPRNAADRLPATKLGTTVSLADKLDTMVGIFGIGLIPTGDKDPYGLRRNAFSIIKMIIENKLNLDIKPLLDFSQTLYGDSIAKDTPQKLASFIFERFRSYFQELKVSNNIIDAVMATSPSRPLDFYQRVQAVKHFLTLPQAEALSSANKRVSNIISKSGLSAHAFVNPQITESLLKEPSELKLYKQIAELEPILLPLIQEGKYTESLTKLSAMKDTVDEFFDKVMVMVDDAQLRHNRIQLLMWLRGLFIKIADISLL